MSQSSVLDMTCFQFFPSLLPEKTLLFSSTEPLSSFPHSSYGDDTAENMAMLLQWLQKSLSLKRPGLLWKKLASYQRPSQHKRWFPKAPCHFQGQPCRPKDTILGMQNEIFSLINLTCKTEENLKIPKIQGNRYNLVSLSPQGLLTCCVKDNLESSLLRKKSLLLCPCSVYFGKTPSLWLVSYWKRLYL